VFPRYFSFSAAEGGAENKAKLWKGMNEWKFTLQTFDRGRLRENSSNQAAE
jgi:hypothetical protein